MADDDKPKTEDWHAFNSMVTNGVRMRETACLRVPGGWMYRQTTRSSAEKGSPIAVAMCFVPLPGDNDAEMALSHHPDDNTGD